MGILNRPTHGQPSVLLALWRTLAACGEAKRRDLVELCTPPTAASDSEQVRKTVNTAVTLGLFRDLGGVLTLSARLNEITSDSAEDPLYRSFRSVVLSAVMADANNRDLGRPGAEGGAGAADFTYATCWMLEQDPLKILTYDRVDELQTHDFPEAVRRPFQNDTRWNGFVDWATFLGMGWSDQRGGGRLVVDPTAAIWWHLERGFQSGSIVGSEDFRSRLADALPILDGGRHRQTYLEGLPNHDGRNPQLVSHTLSFSLTRLTVAGAIELLHQDDAPSAVLLMPQQQSVTHIRILGHDGG